MQKTVVQQVEDYVKQVMKEVAGHHDFKHVDRVRDRALQIAKSEGFGDLELVEVTALLHDIGLAYVKERKTHSQVGSEIADKFLRENNLLTEEKIGKITDAIKYHSSIRDGSGKLFEILRDADVLDALGAVGIMRAFTSKSYKPEYNPENIKGENWGLSGRSYDKLFKKGLEAGNNIIDQINLQISYYDNLATETARQLAKPLVEFMKNYVTQLEHEIKLAQKTT